MAFLHIFYLFSGVPILKAIKQFKIALIWDRDAGSQSFPNKTRWFVSFIKQQKLVPNQIEIKKNFGYL